jgi:hypothetical protein
MKARILSLAIILILKGCTSSTNSIVTNNSKHHAQIESLCKYFSSIRRDSIRFYLVFKESDLINLRIHQKETDITSELTGISIFNKYGFFEVYDIKLSDAELDEPLKYLAINREQVDSLRTLVNKVNCNGIGYEYYFWGIEQPGGQINLAYPTRWYEHYGLEYVIPDSVISQEVNKEIQETCWLKRIDKKVLIRYFGPATGSDCFPDKK